MGNLLRNNIVDAYLEMCLGAAALRTPEAQTVLEAHGKFRIASSYSTQDPTINVPSLLKEIRSQGTHNSATLRGIFTQINRVFLIAMWDMLRDTTEYGRIATHPMIQFFRHIRNGCAHGNHFNIKTPITEPAVWRTKKIEDSLHGATVIPDFLGDGDALLLVKDIDEKYST